MNKKIEVKLKLPKELEECLNYLETTSKKTKDFIIKEALIQYIEDMEDIQRLSVLEGNKKKEKTYTSEELSKSLGF